MNENEKKGGKRVVVVKKRRTDASSDVSAVLSPSDDGKDVVREKIVYKRPLQHTEEKIHTQKAADAWEAKGISPNEHAPAKTDKNIAEENAKQITDEIIPEKKTSAAGNNDSSGVSESFKENAAVSAEHTDKDTDRSAAGNNKSAEMKKSSKAPKIRRKDKKSNKRPKNPDPYARAVNPIERLYISFLDLELGKKIARNKLKTALCAILCIAVTGIIYTVWENNQIGTSFYQLQSNKVSNNIRVVCLADLHLKEFGKNNERLIERIRSLKPDIIACAGDMNTYKEDDYSVVTSLCAEMSDIAPIYYCLGNHEYEAWLFKNSKICDDLKKIGVKVLHNQSEKVIIGTSTIDIGGLSESPKQFEQYGHEFFDKYAESDDFKLLLNHYPEAFLGTMDNYYVDLSLCGHAHGGQIRLPIIGGLYSADQGFFPKYVDGMHVDEEGGGSTFIVSRGLGNSSWMPRINNRPELVVVDINWY